VLISDISEGSHADTCKGIVEAIDGSLTVDIYAGSFQAGVQYALDNGYAVVSRSTTGLTDYDETAGALLLESGGIAIHAHGSNTYEELTNYANGQSIVGVRDSDGSYGTGVTFTIDEPLINGVHQESWSTPQIAGYIAKYAVEYPALSYTEILDVIIANSSNGGELDNITGYGTPDWTAVETALALL